ncbi:MAG: PhoH family protein [Desulfobulbaceae bacterium]|nr:PhoH family protein [Desulfobulbaceae bacterium]
MKSNPEISRELELNDPELSATLYGPQNKHLAIIEQALGVKIHVRGTRISILGSDYDVSLATNLLEQLLGLLQSNYPLFPPDIAYGIRVLEKHPKAVLKDIFLDQVYITGNKRVISPKSINQKSYIDAIKNNDIVFGTGPAGTGKTYLAVAMAVAAYSKNLVRSIILTRPAVEAGEKLGFLPGDLAEKINPYLRPLHDALNDMLGREKAAALIEEEIIEIAPLAFMRGRTLNSAFVILDEAQNTTREQMQMFLTRLGFNSKAVITGDLTQIDLPGKSQSGLLHATKILQGIPGISFSQFTEVDVVRHHLVQAIIKAYEAEKQRLASPRS